MIEKAVKYPIILEERVGYDNEKKLLFLRFKILKELVYFKGHFENLPILPGIAQLEFALFYAEKYKLIKKTNIESIDNLKFTQIIKPGYIVDLKIEKPSNKKLLFNYFNHDNHNSYSSGKISLKLESLCE